MSHNIVFVNLNSGLGLSSTPGEELPIHFRIRNFVSFDGGGGGVSMVNVRNTYNSGTAQDRLRNAIVWYCKIKTVNITLL